MRDIDLMISQDYQHVPGRLFAGDLWTPESADATIPVGGRAESAEKVGTAAGSAKDSNRTFFNGS
jgi:hypothetical protein